MFDDAAAQCFFLSVGQGASNVVLLQHRNDVRRAIVIDCGPRSHSVLQFLIDHHVDELEAIVVSHNHKDHDGGNLAGDKSLCPGLISIVEHYLALGKGRIKRLYMIDDGSPRYLESLKGIHKLFTLAYAGDLSWQTTVLIPLIRTSKTKILFPSDDVSESSTDRPVLVDASAVRLELLFPTMYENAVATSPNVTSAVVRLVHNESSVIYGADINYKCWEVIHQRLHDEAKIPIPDRRPIPCDVFVLSHHGGNIFGCTDPTEQATRTSNLFDTLINPQMAMISVGSNNQYDHPNAVVIEQLRMRHKRILCTQITPRCCNGVNPTNSVPIAVHKLLRHGRNEILPSEYNEEADTTTRDCIGTFSVHITKDGVRPDIKVLADHEAGVAMLREKLSFQPMCLANTTLHAPVQQVKT